MARDRVSITFRASEADRKANRVKPAVALALGAPIFAAATYFLGWVTVLVVALITLAVVVPLALRYARTEDTSEVEVTDDSVIWRRGSRTMAVIDRTSRALEATVFTDSHAMTTQLLLTDGTTHIRLVSGSWSPETLSELAAAVDPEFTVSTWSEVIARHRSVFPLWERRPGLIVVGSITAVLALVFVGILIAMLVFDLG